jgi:hypothetical protein
MNTLCTLIVWAGMHYATPQWVEAQIPAKWWSTYEIHIVKYGTPITQVLKDIDPKTTGLIGFSAGGLDVLANYRQDYALVVLLDPSTRDKYSKVDFGPNTLMYYNPVNWGGTNLSISRVAEKVKASGGYAELQKKPHADILKNFFNTYL